MNVKITKIIIVFGLQILIFFCFYIALKPPSDMDNSELLIKFKVNEQIHDLLNINSEKIINLRQQEKFLEAAILKFQEAAARECLFPERRTIKKNPTVSELEAFRLFKIAEKEEPYRQLLEWKYPDWNEN